MLKCLHQFIFLFTIGCTIFTKIFENIAQQIALFCTKNEYKTWDAYICYKPEGLMKNIEVQIFHLCVPYS